VEQLNFPAYSFRIREESIFDPARRKFVFLSPEEWVRQHVIRFLADDRHFPLSLMAVEVQMNLHGLKKRIDILVHGPQAEPLLIVECKAPSVHITQRTFDQAARYNMRAGAAYFFLTNGHTHYFCKSDPGSASYIFLKDLPLYADLTGI
jgi:hypothetical protein